MRHKDRRTASERGLSRSSSEKHADGSADNATMTIIHPFPRSSSHEIAHLSTIRPALCAWQVLDAMQSTKTHHRALHANAPWRVQGFSGAEICEPMSRQSGTSVEWT